MKTRAFKLVQYAGYWAGVALLAAGVVWLVRNRPMWGMIFFAGLAFAIMWTANWIIAEKERRLKTMEHQLRAMNQYVSKLLADAQLREDTGLIADEEDNDEPVA